jgi:hypothetical protein
LSYGLFGVTIAWIIGVVGLTTPVAWFIQQLVTIEGEAWPWFADPVITWVQVLLIVVPAGVLALLTPHLRLRAAYVTWLLAATGLAALGLARIIPPDWKQALALVQIVVALLLAAGSWRRARRASGPTAPDSLPVRGNAGSPFPLTSALLPLALLPLLIVPWLWRGAFGSPLDLLLNVLVGQSVGLAAGILFGPWLVPVLSDTPGGVGFGGLTAGVALLIVASGTGPVGSNLLVLAALPPLGFGIVALWRLLAPGAGWGWLPISILVGGCAAAPLALFDPQEMALILGDADIPRWAGQAAGLAFVTALVVSLGLWLALILRKNRVVRPGRPFAPALWFLAAGAWSAALLVYFLAGNPGFFGDQLFVILRDQADVSRATTIGNRQERLRFVYGTLTSHARTTQAGLQALLRGFRLQYQPYYLVNALEVDGGPLIRAYLLTRPEVDRVLLSPRLRPLPAPPPPEPGDAVAPVSPPWNITTIGAVRVWNELGVTGQGIVIGQSDSGVDGGHPALRDAYRGRGGQDDYHWLDPWYGAPAPRDYGSHGTHTLGSALGRTGVGVAPGAEWIGCVNLARNLANPAHYLDCMQFMLAPYPRGGDPLADGNPARAAHVLNNSWGCPPEEGCDAESLRAAVDALRAAGIFFVASAGNEGPVCSSVRAPPAIYASAVSIGAINAQGDVTSFSSRGPVEVDGSGRVKPDLVAPGAGVLSAQPAASYGISSGTSMAGPHVAGVVALMWSANPRLVGDIDRTEQLLLETARPYGGATPPTCAGHASGQSNAYGNGVVDAYAAVRAALAAP